MQMEYMDPPWSEGCNSSSSNEKKCDKCKKCDKDNKYDEHPQELASKIKGKI